MGRRPDVLVLLVALVACVAVLVVPAWGADSIPKWPSPAWFAQFGQDDSGLVEEQLKLPEEPGREVLLTREEEKLLDLINRERSKKHLPPLKVDAQLTRVARLKSEDMLENGYFGHSSPTYGKLGDMLKEEGIQYRYAAENIGRGGTVENVHGMMMDSSVHRNAILGRKYTLIGLGVVRTSRGGVIVTEIFVGR